MPFVITRQHSTKLFDIEWPLRTWPDDRHVSAHDIEELRQLVETRTSQDAADSRRPIFATARPDGSAVSFCIRSHRAKLDDLEFTPEFADADLAVENRRARIDEHR